MCQLQVFHDQANSVHIKVFSFLADYSIEKYDRRSGRGCMQSSRFGEIFRIIKSPDARYVKFRVEFPRTQLPFNSAIAGTIVS